MKKLKILVDGFNLQLSKGTGIKTYGSTLLDAYQKMGCEIGILTDKVIPKSRKVVLDEINFFDNQPIRKNKIQIFNEFINSARNIAGIGTSLYIKPQFTEINKKNYLSKKRGKYNHIENIPNIFSDAYKAFKIFGTFPNINASEQPDVLHLTAPWPIRMSKAKTVLTIHDLIPLKLPFTTLDDKSYFYNLVKKSINNADVILSVSNFTKNCIIDTFDVDDEKIHVTYQSIDTSSSFKKSKKSMKKFLKSVQLEQENYVLFVGNIEPKKNLPTLVKAFSTLKLKSKGMKLAIVGSKAWMSEGELAVLTKYLKPDQYEILEYVSESNLITLYKHASCLVFPSIYEGFGLPVLEAMYYKCPVICSNASSIPEVAGGAALYFSPLNEQDLRKKMQDLINNPYKRYELIQKGINQAEKFSPSNYAERLMTAYGSLHFSNASLSRKYFLW